MRAIRDLFRLFLLAVLTSWWVACGDDASKGADREDSGQVGDAELGGKPCDADTDCDNGVFCDGGERCVAHRCASSELVRCDDGIECTVDACVEALETCRSTPADVDGDGEYDARCVDENGDAIGNDCDDTDPLRYPGNIEICDDANHDEDCDSHTNGAKDSDGDGAIDQRCCNAESDAANAPILCGTDCNDLRGSVHPLAAELCDGFDNDCDGIDDEGVQVRLYPDDDRDLRGKAKRNAQDKEVVVMGCLGSTKFALNHDDCDDTDPVRFTGQAEFTDGKDNDCNGLVDDNPQQVAWFADVDADGFGDPAAAQVVSIVPIAGRVIRARDCDDQNPNVSPAAEELCDAADNDCNGVRDFRIGVNDFEDDDGDGRADVGCGASGSDCDDLNVLTGAGANELCDGRDNDCDARVDETVTATVWYTDADHDGYGAADSVPQSFCGELPGHSARGGDCDDADSDVRPGAIESCDGINEDCDGQTDEAPADCGCSLPQADGQLSSGTCRILECRDGYLNCDGKNANGCEVIGATCNGGTVVGDAAVPLPDGGEVIVPGTCEGLAHSGNVVLASAADIAALVGVSCVTGDVLVDASALTNLVGLDSLAWIGGALTITGNSSVTSLAGLGSLTTVMGSFTLSRNPGLSGLAGLVSLRTVGGDFTVSQNDGLFSLNGLGALEKVFGSLRVQSNVLLANLSGVASLREVGGDLEVSLLPALYQLSGFTLLRDIGGDLSVGTNEKLTSLATFGALEHVGGSVDIANNPGLLHIDSFGGLTSVGGDLRIVSDSALQTVSGFGRLSILSSSLLIDGNPELLSVTGFASLTQLPNGSLIIHGNGKLTSLAGFSSLQSLSGNFWINENNALLSLSGANGFLALTSVGTVFSLQDNVSLTSLSGFSQLAYVGMDFTISDNVTLTQLDGFGSLKSVQYNVFIEGNDALQTISGLSALQHVGDSFIVEINRSLTSFSGIDSLVDIGNNLVVQRNPFLGDIAGLRSGTLVAMGGVFEVRANPALSSCEVTSLKTALAATNPGGILLDLSCCNAGCSSCGGTSCAVSADATAGQSGDFVGGAELFEPRDVLSMGNVVSTTGDLRVQFSNIQNFNPLSRLQRIGGDFTLDGNGALTNVNGLSALTSVGQNLIVNGNGVLSNLLGLNNLTDVGTSLTVTSNASLSVCAADALYANLTACGCSLPYTQSANLACTAPDACSGAACQ